MRLPPHRIVFVLLLCIAGCTPLHIARPFGRTAAGTFAAGFDPSVLRDLERLRRATNAYHDLGIAQGAGYSTATPPCVADSTMGGMGRHYFSRIQLAKATLDVEHPAGLLFTPDGGGVWQLAGVEYVIPFSVLPSTATAPRIFGQELKRQEQLRYWYLHVWAWQKNSAGLFADWNPAVKC
jgi:hypothetical protein